MMKNIFNVGDPPQPVNLQSKLTRHLHLILTHLKDRLFF